MQSSSVPVTAVLGNRQLAPAAAAEGAAPPQAAEAPRHSLADRLLAARPITLPEGIRVVPQQRFLRPSVSRAEMADAVKALLLLPTQDLKLAGAIPLPVYLEPVRILEDNLLGATKILQDKANGPWRPLTVRIAMQSGLLGYESPPEALQHEMGHVISVLRSNDRSERAATAYAAAN